MNGICWAFAYFRKRRIARPDKQRPRPSPVGGNRALSQP